MKIKCEHCSQEYEIDETMYGKKVQCTVCHKKFYVPLKNEIFSDDKKNIDLKAIIYADKEKRIAANTRISTDKKLGIEIKLNRKSIIIFVILILVFTVAGLSYFFFIFSDRGKVSVNNKKYFTSKPVAVVPKNGIVCNTFTVILKMVDNSLYIVLKTDLPENCRIGLMIYRDCTGNDNITYSIPYIRKSLNTSDLIKGIKINLTADLWMNEYKKFLDRIKKNRSSFEIKDFSNKVTAYVYLGLSRTKSDLGERNSNLYGKAVTRGNYNTVNTIAEINYPLPDDLKNISDIDTKTIDIDHLIKGNVYKISRKVPLLPAVQDNDSVVKIKDIKNIPEEGYFKVISEVRKKEGMVWYNIEAFGKNHEVLGNGWINSVSLTRQKLFITSN